MLYTCVSPRSGTSFLFQQPLSVQIGDKVFGVLRMRAKGANSFEVQIEAEVKARRKLFGGRSCISCGGCVLSPRYLSKTCLVLFPWSVIFRA